MPLPESGLRYEESGSGDPVLLLDWTPWQATGLREELAARHRVLSVEPPEDARWTPTPGAAAEAVMAAADATGLEACALVGVSLGADAALRLALLRPELAAPLVLASPACVLASDVQEWADPELARSAMLAHPQSGELPDAVRTAVLYGLAELWRQAGEDAVGLLPSLSCATLAVFGQEERLVSR